MSSAQHQIEIGIQALEAQRVLLGDAVVDVSVAVLRAKLAALVPTPGAHDPTQSLRQVSILFLDIAGSTRLSQRLDPEALSAVLDGALTRGTAVVRAHGGRVLQYAGDNILAAFGADEASEDDAERAVRCGLALLELGKLLQAEVQAAHGHAGFQVRVGVHTGAVLLGGGVDADGSIRGVAVNIAARMEQTAPVGAMRISHDTYALVRGLFDVDAQPLLVIKGVDEPVLSYLVNRAKPRSFRIARGGIEGVATRMIGRDVELDQLQDAFKRLFDKRELAAVTVVGDAGIGKSRLLHEFEAWSEARLERFFLFRGRANPQTQGQPYGLLRDILAWRLQIADDDSLLAARAKMEQGIVPLFEADDGADLAQGHAHVLGHLIGIEWRDSRHLTNMLDDPRQMRNRALHVAAQLFRRVSGQDSIPVLLQIEDLQWADSESLDFLNYLVQVNRDVPLLMLAFTRPVLFERRGDWSRSEGMHQRIDLHPLGKDMSRMLANELLKKLPEIPAAVRELLTSSAEGNPFYMEELVRMLIDQGAIETGRDTADAWRVNAERLLVTHVPTTLTGVLQARLDGLPDAEKLALQGASVIGPVFWDRALMAIDAQAQVALPALVRRQLALPRLDASSSATSDDDLREYAFKHQLLHQVTYATVLKRTRRELHGKLALWLAGLTGLRANEFLGVAADHFEQAGDEAQAAEFHARAAERASMRMAHQAALHHVQRALVLLDKRQPGPADDRPLHELRWRLLLTREATLDLQGEREAQQADIVALQALAEVLGDDGRRALAAWRCSGKAMRTADWPTMQAAALQTLHWAGAAGDVALRLMAQRMVALARAHQGDLVEAQAMAEATLVEARALGLHRVQALCLNALALIAGRRGDNLTLLAMEQQALAACQASGERRGEAIGRSNVGSGWLTLGDLAQAQRDLDEGLRLVRANGDRALECASLYHLSLLALWQGDDARALAQARAAVQTAVAVRARDWEAYALLALGEAELALGRHAAAAQAFEQSRACAVSIGGATQHDATAGLARVAMAQGRPLEALLALAPLLDVAATGGGVPAGAEHPRWIELTCHRVLAAQPGGDPQAAGWLSRAHAALQTSAAGLSDTRLRQCYLSNIPHHRDILADYNHALRSGLMHPSTEPAP